MANQNKIHKYCLIFLIFLLGLPVSPFSFFKASDVDASYIKFLVLVEVFVFVCLALRKLETFDFLAIIFLVYFIFDQSQMGLFYGTGRGIFFLGLYLIIKIGKTNFIDDYSQGIILFTKVFLYFGIMVNLAQLLGLMDLYVIEDFQKSSVKVYSDENGIFRYFLDISRKIPFGMEDDYLPRLSGFFSEPTNLGIYGAIYMGIIFLKRGFTYQNIILAFLLFGITSSMFYFAMMAMIVGAILFYRYGAIINTKLLIVMLFLIAFFYIYIYYYSWGSLQDRLYLFNREDYPGDAYLYDSLRYNYWYLLMPILALTIGNAWLLAAFLFASYIFHNPAFILPAALLLNYLNNLKKGQVS